MKATDQNTGYDGLDGLPPGNNPQRACAREIRQQPSRLLTDFYPSQDECTIFRLIVRKCSYGVSIKLLMLSIEGGVTETAKCNQWPYVLQCPHKANCSKSLMFIS